MLACVILPLPQNSPAGWVTPPYGTIKNIALVEGACPARDLTAITTLRFTRRGGIYAARATIPAMQLNR